MRLTGRTEGLVDETELRPLDRVVATPAETVSMAASGLI